MRSAECGVRSAECGVRSAEWIAAARSVRVLIPHSEIRNPN